MRFRSSPVTGNWLAQFNLEIAQINDERLMELVKCFIKNSLYIVTVRRHASSVCAVFVFVRLSQVGVLLKWLNVGSRKHRHTIAQGP